MDASIKGISSSGVSGHIQRPVTPPDPTRISRDHTAVPAKPRGAPEGHAVRKADVHADGGPIVPLEKALPIALLKHAEWVRTEWAWRRLLTEMVNQSTEGHTPTAAHPTPSQAASLPEQPSPQSTEGNGVSGAIDTLWNTLANLASSGHSDDQHAALAFISAEVMRNWPMAAQSPSGGGLISFHMLQKEHLHKELPEKIRECILADRWIGAVHTPDSAMTGAGLWVVPGDVRGGRLQAVHWQAERQTKTTQQGVVVHRLNLVVSYEGQPVRIQFISARPDISIHVSTSHKALRSRLTQCAEMVETSLATLGWRMNQWTVGEWDGEESQ
jgi:hypothetical protein